MYINRKLETKILKFLKNPEIIAVVGPRQCGKTTLLKYIYSHCEKKGDYISFETPDTLSMFERNTPDFINLYVKGKEILFIDEFQYSQHGGKILKQIYDDHKIKIIISGSSAIDLTVKALQFLVGRIFIFELFPFDFEEFLNAQDKNLHDFYQKEIKTSLDDISTLANLSFGDEIASQLQKYFEEYLIYGGYPRVALTDDREERKEILKGIFSTFFLREVRDYLGLIDDYKLRNLIKALSLQIGNLVQYKELSSLSELSFPTLKKYINFMEKSYTCSLTRPFFHNKRKEIVKNPKIYFIDTGLRNLCINDFRNLDSRTDAGSLLENGLFMSLRKQGYPILYWRDKSKHEIDFIIDEIPHKLAIEVKTNSSKCKNNPSLSSFLRIHSDFLPLFFYLKGFSPSIRGTDLQPIKLPAYII